MAAKNCEVTSA